MSNKLTKDISKRLYFFASFDGYLQIQPNCVNARLNVTMTETHIDYILKVASTLDELEIGHNIYTPKLQKKQTTPQIRIDSKTHPIFTAMHKRIYIDGRKVIDPHMLTMMDAEALAIMYMADGGKYIQSDAAEMQYKLYINNYSFGDQTLIKQSIKETLGIEVNIQRHADRFQLSVPRAYSNAFEDVISPFVLPSFQYKLGR
jgi:ribosomal protein L31